MSPDLSTVHGETVLHHAGLELGQMVPKRKGHLYWWPHAVNMSPGPESQLYSINVYFQNDVHLPDPSVLVQGSNFFDCHHTFDHTFPGGILAGSGWVFGITAALAWWGWGIDFVCSTAWEGVSLVRSTMCVLFIWTEQDSPGSVLQQVCLDGRIYHSAI